MENMDRPGFIESLGMPEVHYATLANQVLRRVKRVGDTVHHCVEGRVPPTVALIGEVIVELKREVESAYEEWEGSQL